MAALSALSKGENYGEGQYYKLTVNIDLSGYNWQPICSGGIYYFKCNFDGNGKYVKLNVSSKRAGLFGGYGTSNLTSTVMLKNLTIKGNVEGEMWSGGLASFAHGAIISNVVNEANITNTKNTNGDNDAGGLVGRISMDAKVTFINCVNKGIVRSRRNAGGIVGFVRRKAIGVFENCENLASVITTLDHVGGIVGYGEIYAEDTSLNGKITINNCIVELDDVEEISAAEIKASSAQLFGEESPYVGWFIGCCDILYVDYV